MTEQLRELLAIAPRRAPSQGFTMAVRDPLETDGIFFTLEMLAMTARIYRAIHPDRTWRDFTRHMAEVRS